MTTNKERMIRNYLDFEAARKVASEMKEEDLKKWNFRGYQRNQAIEDSAALNAKIIKLKIRNQYGIIL